MEYELFVFLPMVSYLVKKECIVLTIFTDNSFFFLFFIGRHEKDANISYSFHIDWEAI